MGFILGNSYYTLINGSSWTQAESNANSIGGNLANITSVSENSFIYSSFQSSVSTSACWIYLAWTGSYWGTYGGQITSLDLWGPNEPNNSFFGIC